jgi:predicted ribosome quality control (RQC) complex YloA/Tae2 family protein
MKEETVYFDDRVVVYYIGTNAADNFSVIDMGNPDDLWFHAKDVSSCHVVAKIPITEVKEGIDKQGLKSIIKKGALICKQNTSKLKSLNNVEFIYAKVQNVTKTNIPGLVTTNKQKTIVC